MGTPEGTNKNWVIWYTICHCPCPCPCILLVLNLRVYKLHFYYSNDYEIVFIFCIYNDVAWMWNVPFFSCVSQWKLLTKCQKHDIPSVGDIARLFSVTQKSDVLFSFPIYLMHTLAKPAKCVCACDFPQRKISWSPKKREEQQKARTSHSFIFISLRVIKS